ncbi:MAG: hypothetical protein WAV41_05150 [Microgenomates group bacterium]
MKNVEITGIRVNNEVLALLDKEALGKRQHIRRNGSRIELAKFDRSHKRPLEDNLLSYYLLERRRRALP